MGDNTAGSNNSGGNPPFPDSTPQSQAMSGVSDFSQNTPQTPAQTAAAPAPWSTDLSNSMVTPQTVQPGSIGSNPVVSPGQPFEGIPTPASVSPVGVPAPEVVSGGNHQPSNKPWIVLGVVVLMVVLGVMGAFAYFSIFPTEQSAPSPAPVAVVATPTPVPSPSVPTLSEQVQGVEVSLDEMESNLGAIDNSLNDKIGDLK